MISVLFRIIRCPAFLELGYCAVNPYMPTHFATIKVYEHLGIPQEECVESWRDSAVGLVSSLISGML